MKTLILLIAIYTDIYGVTHIGAVDNVSFTSIKQCESYKERRNYTSSKILKFQCQSTRKELAN